MLKLTPPSKSHFYKYGVGSGGAKRTTAASDVRFVSAPPMF